MKQITLKAPENASGASINGVSYPVLNGVVTVPESDASELMGFHGFTVWTEPLPVPPQAVLAAPARVTQPTGKSGPAWLAQQAQG